MAVDKALTPQEDPVLEENPEDTPFPDVEGATTTQEDDGGVTVEFGEDPAEDIDITASIPHDANLADYIKDNELEKVSTTLVSAFEADRQSRRDWADAYMRGLDLLGMKIEDRQ